MARQKKEPFCSSTSRGECMWSICIPCRKTPFPVFTPPCYLQVFNPWAFFWSWSCLHSAAVEEKWDMFASWMLVNLIACYLCGFFSVCKCAYLISVSWSIMNSLNFFLLHPTVLLCLYHLLFTIYYLYQNLFRLCTFCCDSFYLIEDLAQHFCTPHIQMY